MPFIHLMDDGSHFKWTENDRIDSEENLSLLCVHIVNNGRKAWCPISRNFFSDNWAASQNVIVSSETDIMISLFHLFFPPQDDGGVTGIFTHIFEHGLWRVGIVVENTTLFFPPLGDMRIKMETEMGSRNSAERLLAQVNGKTAWVASYLEKPLPRKRLITTTTTATHIEVGKNVVRTMLHTVPLHHD